MDQPSYTQEEWEAAAMRISAAEAAKLAAVDQLNLAKSRYEEAMEELRVSRAARNEMIVTDPAGVAEVARRARVTHPFVSKLRRMAGRIAHQTEYTELVERRESGELPA